MQFSAIWKPAWHLQATTGAAQHQSLYAWRRGRPTTSALHSGASGALQVGADAPLAGRAILALAICEAEHMITGQGSSKQAQARPPAAVPTACGGGLLGDVLAQRTGGMRFAAKCIRRGGVLVCGARGANVLPGLSHTPASAQTTYPYPARGCLLLPDLRERCREGMAP